MYQQGTPQTRPQMMPMMPMSMPMGGGGGPGGQFARPMPVNGFSPMPMMNQGARPVMTPNMVPGGQMNMQMRPGMMPMMRPPTQQSQQQQPMGPPVKPLLPYINTYAARLKESQQHQGGDAPSTSTVAGVSTLLMPPTGIVIVGKRKRATRVETMNLDDEIGSVSNSEDEIDRDDPKDVDAEAVDDRLRIMQRQHLPGAPAAVMAAAAVAKEKARQLQARRLKKTRHEYLLPFYRDASAALTESLVPIRLDFEIEGLKLKDAFMWNLKEKFLTPKKFAEFICEDLDIPSSTVEIIEDAIKAQINEHLNLLASEVPFEDDTRIVINLDILFNQYHLIDRFEWDLASPLTPEEFALQLAKDLGLGSEFPPLVAHAIHEQIAKVKTVVASASNNNPNNQPPPEDVDEGNLILGMLRESTRPLEVGYRQGREHDIEEWGPIVEEMSRESVEKYIAEKEKDKLRRQRTNRVGALNRRRSNYFIDFNAPFMNPGNLFDDEETWATPEDRSLWKCTYCLCSGKQTMLPRTGPNGPKTLCNACGLFFRANNELPAHRRDLFK
ncbi:hypothetical protein BDR26DRAFT_917016 [Obelidium mucronatum]|nr:hypothetical protein BDR26DRAFT_917016 [Obelidium mucronatum]